MRTVSLSIGLGVYVPLLLAGASVGSAQEVAGTWSVSVDLGGVAAGEATVVLRQSGDALTGSYAGDLGDHELTGSIQDGDILFAFDVDGLGEFVYLGRLIGEQIEGRCAYGNLGSGTFVAKRSGQLPPDPG